MFYKKIIHKLVVLYEMIKNLVYKDILIPSFLKKRYTKFSNYKIESVRRTAYVLANSNKSMGRFGDGEFMWLVNKNSAVRFEKPSKKLSKGLKKVLCSNDEDFMVALPDPMRNLKHLRSESKFFWEKFFISNNDYLKYLNKDKSYYNSFVSRPYMDYNCRIIAEDTFNYLKEIWENKKILIIEGNESHLGLNNDLFYKTRDIKRIECPVTNAFQCYEEILNKALLFLKDHSDYITLISLGPTATVLAYDLFKCGYRAIDIGHFDIEYEWYLLGAKEKVNLPDRYISEVDKGQSADQVFDKSFLNQIMYKIK